MLCNAGVHYSLKLEEQQLCHLSAHSLPTRTNSNFVLVSEKMFRLSATTFLKYLLLHSSSFATIVCKYEIEDTEEPNIGRLARPNWSYPNSQRRVLLTSSSEFVLRSLN